MAPAGVAAMTGFAEDLDCLREEDFNKIASFILAASGINLPPTKRVMVEGRLRRRARRLGVPTLRDYLRLVFDSADDRGEVIGMIDALTTNKTDFFREPVHFDYIKRVALPELAESGRQAKLWSAACSIGPEPYTLAMVCSDFAADQPGFRYSILASDISTQALAGAVKAIYPEDAIEPVPPAMRRRYLLRANDPTRKIVRIAPEIRAQVRFARINLVEDRYAAGRDMDLILCRNLLIYFDRRTQEQVIRRLSAHLRPGGFLILGHTDSVAGMTVPLQPCGNSIFRRK